MIADRNLKLGTVLMATYKGTEHRAVVGAAGAILMEGHPASRSVSQAASLITGGSVNGWKFWTVAGITSEGLDQIVAGKATEADLRNGEMDEAAMTRAGIPSGIERPKRRSKRDAHTKEISIGAPIAQKAIEIPLTGQGFVMLNVCSECGGQLREARGEYHERRWPEAPICCKCRKCAA